MLAPCLASHGKCFRRNASKDSMTRPPELQGEFDLAELLKTKCGDYFMSRVVT